MVEQGGQEEELHKLLECYMYLKVYQVLGNVRMTELRGQKDVWNHLFVL